MVLFVVGISFSQTQDYPSRPVTLLVTAPPGGSTDLGARAFASVAEKYLGQRMVVINKSGAGGMEAAVSTASAKPDGYTLGWFIDIFAVPEMYTYFRGVQPYTSKDLRPIANLVKTGQLLAVRVDAPWKSFTDLIAYSKKNPKLKFGSNPEGSRPNIVMRMISDKEGLQWEPVPLRDDPFILTNLLGGHVPMGTVGYGALKPQLDAGNVKMLVVFSDQRLTVAPEIPAVTEFGYSIGSVPIMGLFAPKGIPDAVAGKLEAAAGKTADAPSFKEKMQNIGFRVTYMDSQQLAETVNKNKVSLEKIFKQYGYWK